MDSLVFAKTCILDFKTHLIPNWRALVQSRSAVRYVSHFREERGIIRTLYRESVARLCRQWLVAQHSHLAQHG